MASHMSIADRDTAIVESSREMATLGAEGVTALGVHITKMAQIVSAGSSRDAIQQIQMEHARYEKQLRSFKDERRRLEDKLHAEHENMVAWRHQMGGRGGPSLIDELRALQKKVAEMEELLGKEKELLAGERIFRVRLEAMQAKQQEKVKEIVKMWMSDNAAKLIPNIIQLWKRYTDREIKIRIRENTTRETLLIERHRKMRKDSCKRVLNSLRTGHTRLVMATCFLALQEELIEKRQERLNDELKRRCKNDLDIMMMQVAQATGDEEKAKELVDAHHRRLMDAFEATKEAERQRDEARQAEKDMDEQKALAEQQVSVTLGEKAHALEEKHQAEVDAENSRQETQRALEQTAKMNEEMLKAIEEKEDAILDREMFQRKNRKLTLSLAELGAESDDDEPEEDRAKPWFIDEQGVKRPRPRTRKERMQMSFDEALSCRHEMRLQLAAIIDKDLRQEDRIEKLTDLVRVQDRSLTELKSANDELQGELDAELSVRRNQSSQDAHRIEKLSDLMKQKDRVLSELKRENQKLQRDIELQAQVHQDRISVEAHKSDNCLDHSISELRQANQVLQSDLQVETSFQRNQSSQQALHPLKNAPSLSPRAVAAAEFKELVALANLKGIASFRPKSAVGSKPLAATRLSRPRSAACVTAEKENESSVQGGKRASSATSKRKQTPAGTLIPFSVDPRRVNMHVAWR
eukprot:gnl/MRDRNA2_/MRDRNA2_100020_c0_seq1.p1 gnl/MRDRNA2_/MRDRNA2_100020_c0~~gnl/MRDRNA2_/MRDRNA2_100020_c0_seq1.p1  ORF type:complete len:694 (-),score=154.63 gnl/MRDRNA2_/MRDRNA2_100020_c0_seq1:173-2254(-)